MFHLEERKKYCFENLCARQSQFCGKIVRILSLGLLFSGFSFYPLTNSTGAIFFPNTNRFCVGIAFAKELPLEYQTQKVPIDMTFRVLFLRKSQNGLMYDPQYAYFQMPVDQDFPVLMGVEVPTPAYPHNLRNTVDGYVFENPKTRGEKDPDQTPKIGDTEIITEDLMPLQNPAPGK